jgi:hypothetical protein
MQTRFHPRHSSEQHLYLFAVGQIPTGRRRSRFSHANHIRRRKYLHISLRALKTRQRAPKHIYGVPRYAFVISTLRTIFAAGNEEYPIS